MSFDESAFELITRLTDLLAAKDERIAELTDLLLKTNGLTDTQYHIPDSSIQNPVPLGKTSNWLRRKAALERKFSTVVPETLPDDDEILDEPA